MNIFSIIKSISSHPLNKKRKLAAVWRFLKWQISIRLNPKPMIYTFTTRSKLIIHRGMTGATGNLYCGLQDFEDMGFLLHFLRPEDFFVDIGANIGSYTVLASAHVGAKTLAVEPVPSTQYHLKENISINKIHALVTVLPFALGSKKNKTNFAISKDMMNNHVATSNDDQFIEVQIETLDEILAIEQIPILIKIDVEGFESEVLKGAMKTLKNPGLKAIIIELMGLGERYGFDENNIHKLLLELDFKPAKYDPFHRQIDTLDSFGKRNTLYIRDLKFVESRVKSAEQTTILDQVF